MNHAETLRRARYLASRGSVEIVVDRLDWTGVNPLRLMTFLSDLLCRGAHIDVEAEKVGQLSLDRLVPALLSELSAAERRATSIRTSRAVQDAKASGSSLGRPLVMTPERRALAVRMLSQGKRGPQVLALIRGLGGPSISQSAYYLWQKAWLTEYNGDCHR